MLSESLTIKAPLTPVILFPPLTPLHINPAEFIVPSFSDQGLNFLPFESNEQIKIPVSWTSSIIQKKSAEVTENNNGGDCNHTKRVLKMRAP